MKIRNQTKIRFLCFIGILILLIPSDICLSKNEQEGRKFETVIISHPSVKIMALSPKDIQYLFLEKMTKVETDDNTNVKVSIVTLKKGPVHEKFLSEFIKKTVSQYKMYWRKKVFSGSGRIPRSFDKEVEIVKYISENKGAIGYISKKTAADPSIMKDSGNGKNKVVIIPLSIEKEKASDDK